MSSSSWKKYGGISQSNDFNTINASTIIADKFISRSVRPTYQYYNGTYEVSQDLSAGVNILAGNSTYTHVDAYVNRNIYANQKIYFGGGEFENTGNVFPELPPDTTHAYFYGDASNIGVNTLTPKTIFNITGKIVEDTDILTVESGNIYIRNILAQNKDARGVVLDANDVESNIHFYTDVSTNALNAPDATIKYTQGHVLSTTTEEGITSRSRYTRTDTSGGYIYFDGEEYRIDASVNMFFDSSSNIYVHASNNITIDASNGLLRIDDAGLMLSTDGTLVLNSSGGLIEVFSEVAQFNTLLGFAPPDRGISLESLHNETLGVYDNRNQVYLKNVYDNNNIQTGNAITAIAKDASANTFIRMIAPINNRGSAIGGGVYPKDTDRSMAMFGVSDSSGIYIPSQMIVSSNSREKYASTLGINTFSPKTEQYVLDVNGPMQVGNGEINTVAEMNFEIKQMSFSKTHSNCGIAAGTPSTAVPAVGGIQADYQQYLLYTKDEGKTWTPSDIYGTTNDNSEANNNVIFNTVDVYDSSYAFVGGDTINYAYITNDGGARWVRIQGLGPILAANLTKVENREEVRLYISDQSTDLSQNIFYVDISMNNIQNADTIDVSSGLRMGEKKTTPILSNINKSVLTTNYMYLVGVGGIIRYDRSTGNVELQVNSGLGTYFDIYAYDEENLIAVGENIISYYKNTTWTTFETTIGDVNLQRVFMYDAQNIVAVGSSGEFIYTSTGPAAANWKHVPDAILNTSGMKDRLTGAGNNLRGLAMPDKNTFLIADVVQAYNNPPTQLGYSKIQYAFLPNLLNREENVVIDVCGNMVISGDVYINDDGKFYVDATTHLNGDVSMNSKMFVADDVSLNRKLFVADDVSLNSKLFVGDDVSLNSNLYVKLKTVNNGDVSMNSKLFVQDDVSLNSKLFVQDQIIMPSLSTVLVNIIDGNKDDSGYQTNPNHSHNIHIGGNTRITNIGPVDIEHKQDLSLNESINYINIGAINPSISDPPIIIRIGNYSNNLNGSSNRIYIGGGNDEVQIAGNVQFTTLEQMRVNNILVELNANENDDNTSAGAGIIIRDNSNSRAGYLLVSENRRAYNLQAPIAGSHPIALETQQMNLAQFTVPNADVGIKNSIENGIMVLTRGLNSDASYSLVVRHLDISNILVRDSATSNDEYQNILTNLMVKKDISLNSRLFVGQDASFNANVYIKKNLVVEEDLSLNGRFSVQKDASFNSNVYIKEDLSLNGRFSVQKDASFNQNVYIQKDLIVDGNLSAKYYNNEYILNVSTTNYTVIIAEDLSLNGRIYIADDAAFNSNVYINGKTTNNGDVSMNSRLFVQEDASFNRDVYINGKTTNNGDVVMKSRLLVQQDASFNSNVYINGKTTNNGDVSMNSRLFVQEDASFNRDVYINGKTTNNGDVVMKSRLLVQQDASFNSNVYINGKTTNNGDVSMNSRLFVQQDASFNSNVYINGKTTNNGDVSMNSRLFVQEDASFNRNVYINGDLSLNGNLYTNANIEVDGSMNIAGNVSIGQLTSGAKLEVYRNAASTTNNETTGLVFKASYERTATDISLAETGIRVGEYTENREDIPLTVYGNGEALLRITTASIPNSSSDPSGNRVYIQPWVGIGTDAPQTSVDISYTDAIRIPRGSTEQRPVQQEAADIIKQKYIGSIRYNTQTYQFEGFGPGNAWGSLGGVINVAQTTKIVASYPYADSSNDELMFYTNGDERMRIYASGDVSMNERLFVQKDASFNGKVYVESATVLNGDVSMNNRLFVGEDASFNGNVYVESATVLNGDVSMNHRLFVGEDASFNGNVYIKGNTTCNGDVSMNGNLVVGGEVNATAFNATSDYRIKSNVQPLVNGIYVVDNLNPVSYINKLTNKQDIGLIAHELQEHYPFLVNGEKDGPTTQSVNYIGLIGMLIHEIQQLKIRVSTLESRNA
jgi:UDP-3-O-[3-hydroxymyristoyl] glucosamine N-acyltransferase